jgi:hypothetical protein
MDWGSPSSGPDSWADKARRQPYATVSDAAGTTSQACGWIEGKN